MSEFIKEETADWVRLTKYDSVIAELVKILTPHIKKIIVAELTSDDQFICDRIKTEVSEAFEKYDLDAAITSVIDHYDFDQIIETRCDELDLVNEDTVKEIIDDHSSDTDFESYRFRDAVKDVVRDMDFKVQID